MSRAQVRGFPATQTCTPHIRKACRPNHRRLAGNLVPELGALGLHCEKERRYGAAFRTALIAIGHQP